MVITIDTSKCFECGNPAHEQHHVIPQVRGGQKTIPLCSPCHGKVHDTKRSDNLSQLIKEGLHKAKCNGIKLGNPNGWGENQKLGSIARSKQAIDNENNIQATTVINDCRDAGMSFRDIVKKLNEMNYKTSKNKPFSVSSVYKLYNRNNSKQNS